MSDRSGPSGWLSEQTGLSLLTLVSVLLAALIVLPYLQYVLLGVVLAYVLMPAQRRLERHVRSMTAALTLVVVAILAILLPIAYVLAVALAEALEVVTAVREGTLNAEDVERRLEETGYALDLGDTYETYREPISTGLQGLGTSAIEFVGGLPGILIGLTVTLFVLFALLRDGDRLVGWLGRVLPVEDDVQRELIAELDQLMWASVVGNVAVAAIQAVLLGVGVALLGVPAVAFLTVATFLLALLPLVGAFGVWVPVTLYLIVLGQTVPAVILVVYGSLVSASDTYLRPALIGRTSAFNSAIVVVGIFGGLVVFGAVGLFIGPVVLGGAKITLDLFARERGAAVAIGTPEAEDPAVDTEDETGIATEIDADDTGEDGDSGPTGGTDPTADSPTGPGDETVDESDSSGATSGSTDASGAESVGSDEESNAADVGRDTDAGPDTDPTS